MFLPEVNATRAIAFNSKKAQTCAHVCPALTAASHFGILDAMRRTVAAALIGLFAFGACAETVYGDGTRRPDDEVAGEANEQIAAHGKTLPSKATRRLAFGYMNAEEFIDFLHGGKPPSNAETLDDLPLATVLLLVLVGGLAMNLTPCVLPLVPVSLALVGRGAARGAAYGIGMTLAYGALGLATAFGGLAFGSIQSSPWFNLAAAMVFTVLGLATGEVFFIDFSRFRPRPKQDAGTDAKRGLLGPFALGACTAVLAGACVAPILLATLVLTAKWFAAGRTWAVALPFVLGAGMGLPWPFLTAGLSVLPKPGAWMRWVNRVFAVALLGFAAWYGWLAWKGFSAAPDGTKPVPSEATVSDGRPRLVIVGAPWCKNCTAMERTTLKDPAVAKALEGFNVKHVEIDGPEDLEQHRELDGLDIKGVPAYVVIEGGGAAR